MNGLSLFTGSGIGELAFKHIFKDYRTVGYVEIDKYCRSVIRARIRDGLLDDAPIFDDIRTFNERYAGLYTGKVDWLSGGFPCQPFSVAGRRLGEADERNMWPATRDAIRILRPRYVFLENVPGIAAYRYEVFAGLVECGYGFEWDIIPASFVGSGHSRERWWVVAYSEDERRGHTLNGAGGGYNKGRLMAQVPVKGSPSFDAQRFREQVCAAKFVRTANGVADRVDRIAACGNGWVPQVVARILDVRYGGDE